MGGEKPGERLFIYSANEDKKYMEVGESLGGCQHALKNLCFLCGAKLSGKLTSYLKPLVRLYRNKCLEPIYSSSE